MLHPIHTTTNHGARYIDLTVIKADRKEHKVTISLPVTYDVVIYKELMDRYVAGDLCVMHDSKIIIDELLNSGYGLTNVLVIAASDVYAEEPQS